MLSKKNIGYEGENIAKRHYEDRGYKTVIQNYTIRGGELDIVVENKDLIIFVEVKVINSIDDISGYISQKKLNFLHKTIQCYISQNNTNKEYRLDAVFIKGGKIYEIYENLYL